MWNVGSMYRLNSLRFQDREWTNQINTCSGACMIITLTKPENLLQGVNPQLRSN